MEHILLKEIEEQIKEAKDASEAAKTTNERELILTQLNLLLQQKYVLLTRLFPPPPTTGICEFILIEKIFILAPSVHI